MKNLFPFIGGAIGGAIGALGFPASAPGNQTLYALLGGGGIFLLLGVMVWVLPALPQPTQEQREYWAWDASWTPPEPPVYREDPYVQHQRHLQEQARMGWLMGDRDYPPTDWFGR